MDRQVGATGGKGRGGRRKRHSIASAGSSLHSPRHRLLIGFLAPVALRAGVLAKRGMVSTDAPTWRFCVAPMMDWTDRHCRFFHRLMSRRARLYTEMLTTGAVIHGDRTRLLAFDAAEHPVALQLGGSEPAALVTAARIGADMGYDEINLNVGCPSDRVQEGRFGACLMAEPGRVADSVAAMKSAVAVPVTVKCRLGIDEQDTEEALDRIRRPGHRGRCDVLIVHARKAWLKGLSPRENRDVPPLDHARVHRLKLRLGDFPVVINGGIHSLDDVDAHLAHVDGVMLGRGAYEHPSILLDVDPRVFDRTRRSPMRVRRWKRCFRTSNAN